jgi:hypothetical protein
MKQYTYEATNRRTGRVEHIRATASTPDIARAAIVEYYADQFEISELFADIDPPHHTLGEIDCAA